MLSVDRRKKTREYDKLFLLSWEDSSRSIIERETQHNFSKIFVGWHCKLFCLHVTHQIFINKVSLTVKQLTMRAKFVLFHWGNLGFIFVYQKSKL